MTTITTITRRTTTCRSGCLVSVRFVMMQQQCCWRIFGRTTRRLTTTTTPIPEVMCTTTTTSSSLTTPEAVTEDEDLRSTTSITNMLKPYFEQQQPVILRGAVLNQPAIHLWKSWDYLNQQVNPNTMCSVEIGGSYNSGETAEICFGDYISYMRFFEERHGRRSSSSRSNDNDITIPNNNNNNNPAKSDLVYLAQNNVVGSLQSDFTIPPFTKSLGYGHLYSVMMWIGPYGCISPLHYDPLDNVLMQYVGIKRILLYPPDTELYAGVSHHHQHQQQPNTSPYNPEDPPDLMQFPQLATLPPALDCHLFPGDALYIPSKWWHYVRTVETSLSINAWWR